MTFDSNTVTVMEETSAYRLARLISILGTNATEFAKANNIPKSSLSLYLSGQRKMKQDRIGQLSYKYNIDPAWLMGYDVPMKRVRTPDGKYTTESALLVSQIRSDKEFTEAAKIYFSLPDTKKKLIVDLIKNMAE